MSFVSTWISLHPVLFQLVIWPAITGLITWLFKPRTPEQYAAMNPRIAALLKLVGSLGLDIPKLLEGARQLITGSTANSTGKPVLASKAVKAASVPPPALDAKPEEKKPDT